MLFIKAKLKISWMLQTSIRGITGLEKYFAAFDKVIITTEKGETIICKTWFVGNFIIIEKGRR